MCAHHAPLPVAGGESNCHVCVLTAPLCSAIKLKNTHNSPQYQGNFPPLTPLSPITHSHTCVVLNSPPPNGELPLTVASQRRVTPHGVQSASPAVTVHRSVAGTAGVSEWVMKSIKNGYTLQFFRRPPRFNSSTVRERNASVLREEIHNLLAKRAIEAVPLTDRESGFYSRYFLVPKKNGGLRPILDLRPLNRALSKRSFKMITLRQILSHIRPGDWCISMDLKDAYFHIQVAPCHRRFLRFAFEGIVYQFTVLPFGLCLAPCMFTKCMGAALTPLKQNGMRVLNYLNDWLVLAQSESALLSDKFRLLAHIQVQTPCSYSELRADCKYAKEHAGTELEHLLFRSGAELNQNASASVGGALTKIDQFSRSLQIRVFSPAKMLSVDARPDGCCLDSVQSRAPTYASSSALVKEPGATERMAHGHLAH